MDEEPCCRHPVEADLGVIGVDELVIVDGVRADVEAACSALKPRWLRVDVDLARGEEAVELEGLRARGRGDAEEKDRERFTHHEIIASRTLALQSRVSACGDRAKVQLRACRSRWSPEISTGSGCPRGARRRPPASRRASQDRRRRAGCGRAHVRRPRCRAGASAYRETLYRRWPESFCRRR